VISKSEITSRSERQEINMKQKIGFIGLGVMGKPMAKNLLKGGYALAAHDLNREAAYEIVSEGATVSHSPREIAEVSDLIITMLPDSPDVEAVALGQDGLIEGIQKHQFYIDMSTIAPTTAIRVAQLLGAKGARCLDAPVSGGDIGAINATLSIMVGGDETDFRDVLPIFETLGKTITFCGPIGSGQIVKACNQIQVALNLIGMAEALTLGTKAGVDPAIIIKVLSGGYAQTRVMDVRGPRVIKGDYKPGFKSKLHFKDLNIILESGRYFECPLPTSALARELFSAMLAAGRGDLDHSGIITVLEDMAHVQVRTKKSDQR
jgi:2-hydroxy-3-oxopropionate reductase